MKANQEIEAFKEVQSKMSDEIARLTDENKQLAELKKLLAELPSKEEFQKLQDQIENLQTQIKVKDEVIGLQTDRIKLLDKFRQSHTVQNQPIPANNDEFIKQKIQVHLDEIAHLKKVLEQTNAKIITLEESNKKFFEEKKKAETKLEEATKEVLDLTQKLRNAAKGLERQDSRLTELEKESQYGAKTDPKPTLKTSLNGKAIALHAAFTFIPFVVLQTFVNVPVLRNLIIDGMHKLYTKAPQIFNTKAAATILNIGIKAAPVANACSLLFFFIIGAAINGRIFKEDMEHSKAKGAKGYEDVMPQFNILDKANNAIGFGSWIKREFSINDLNIQPAIN